MKGTIATKGNRYYPVIDLGKHPETGKRRRKWHEGYDRKRDAQQALNDILSQKQSGDYVAPHRTTLSEFLTKWLETRSESVAETTHANYRHQIESYVIPHLGSRKLQDLSALELSDFYAVLLKSGRTRAPGGLSATSVGNVHRVVSKAMGDAVKWNLLTRNPATYAEVPKAQRREMHVWSADQVKAFLAAEKDTREFPIWVVASTTGMRRGEILGLSWTAVDLDVGRLSVVQTLVNLDNKPTLRKEAKTASGHRSVELDRDTVEVLRQHRRQQAQERLRAGSAWADHGLVFCRENGTPDKPERVTRAFGTRTQAAGLPKIRFHDLRHTWATLALGEGVHPKIVSERLGHSSIGITLDIYSHVTPGMDREAAETVSALFR